MNLTYTSSLPQFMDMLKAVCNQLPVTFDLTYSNSYIKTPINEKYYGSYIIDNKTKRRFWIGIDFYETSNESQNLYLWFSAKDQKQLDSYFQSGATFTYWDYTVGSSQNLIIEKKNCEAWICMCKSQVPVFYDNSGSKNQTNELQAAVNEVISQLI